MNPKLALNIAKAESNFIPTARNTSSSASGLYQYIDGTFKDFCITKYGLATSMEQKNDPKIQAECAVRMLSEGGEGHWNESRANWSRQL